MPFVAHVGIQLANDECPNEKNIWHTIRNCNGIEYRWKFTNDKTYHAIAGVFNNPHRALDCAKELYVALLYSLLTKGIQISDAGCNSYEGRFSYAEEISVEDYNGDEWFFFWNKSIIGGRLGPGVFEVESSLEEFEEYRFLKGRLSIICESGLNFEEVDKRVFLYCREAQGLFNAILLAEDACDIGIRMTIYCGLLEHLSQGKNKEDDVVSVLEELIEHVERTTVLSREKKESLINYLKIGKRESSRQKCLKLCDVYANKRYGGVTCKQIIDEAYKIRSAFSHGEKTEKQYSKYAALMKVVVLDVIKNYMREKENESNGR